MTAFMDIFKVGSRIDRPIFKKEFDDSSELITELEVIADSIKEKAIQDEIAKDIFFIKAGDQGEKNVYYEIKNSFLPMIVLHNVAIEYDDYKAQMDFIIITKNFICILETKKLNGNISINTNGDFVRSFTNKYGKVYKKEGMYSPIAQNQRHVRILEHLLKQEKVIKNTQVLSLVVIANPRSIIDFKYAKKEIKEQIVKYDQLTPRIKNLMLRYDSVNLSESSMNSIADYIYEKHTVFVNPFIPKYMKHVKNEATEYFSWFGKEYYERIGGLCG